MLPCGTYNEEYRQDMAVIRTPLQWGLFIALLLFVFTLPLYLRTDLMHVVNLMGIAIIAVLGLNILTGYGGQISIGQAAFMAVGAFSSAFLTTELGLSFWLALPCAAIIAGLVSALFGLPALRVKELYLVVSTLAAQFIILYVIYHLPWFGKDEGMSLPAPTLGGITFATDKSYYYIILVAVIIMAFFCKNIGRTPVGRAFIAIRDNDLAAEVMGINIGAYKVLAFFICGIYAGVAGALFAHLTLWIGVEAFPIIDSIWYLGMLIVGGMGSTAGAIMGAIALKGLEQASIGWICPALLQAFPAMKGDIFAALSLLFYAVVIILFLIYEPRGLYHRWEIFKNSYRLHPFSY